MFHLPFAKLFIAAAIWNLIGAFFGYFNTADTFELTFNKELADPLMFAIYKGSWGTTLTYVMGYLLVAYNPYRHFGIVFTGGIGKLGFIATLISLYFSGLASEKVFIIIFGDAIFLVLFVNYFFSLYQNGNSKIPDQRYEQ